MPRYHHHWRGHEHRWGEHHRPRSPFPWFEQGEAEDEFAPITEEEERRRRSGRWVRHGDRIILLDVE